MKKIFSVIAPCLFTFSACLIFSACKKDTPPPPPPPEVGIMTVQGQTIAAPYDFEGVVQSYRTVEVRSQISGVILDRLFKEGAAVNAGEVLYHIDRTIYESAFKSAKARLVEADARLANAKTNAERYQKLIADNAVSKQEADNADEALKNAQANVDDATAAVEQAKKNLDYTVIRAEISGRVGRALLDVGTRVTPFSDILTTLDVLSPIYVSFNPPAQQLIAWKNDPVASNALQTGGSVRVIITLPDGSMLPDTGKIAYINPVVDPQTGTQQFRAIFSNDDKMITPGEFVRVHVLGLVHDSSIVVPQRAVQRLMGRQIVYVIGNGDSVSQRQVTATTWIGDKWEIDQGLSSGDRIIVDGVQKVRPGMVVRTAPIEDTTMYSGAPGASNNSTNHPSAQVAGKGN